MPITYLAFDSATLSGDEYIKVFSDSLPAGQFLVSVIVDLKQSSGRVGCYLSLNDGPGRLWLSESGRVFTMSDNIDTSGAPGIVALLCQGTGPMFAQMTATPTTFV